MSRAGRRPSASLVLAFMALLASIGGTAWAAKKISGSQIKQNTITSANLKDRRGVNRSVIVPGSLTGSNFKAGSVPGSKLAPGSVSGADIDSGSVPALQRVGTYGGSVAAGLTGAITNIPLPNNTYSQPAGRDDIYVPGATVTFSSGCAAPRSATVYLSGTSSTTFSGNDVMGGAVVVDQSGAGNETRTAGFSPQPGTNFALQSFRPESATPHVFTLFATGFCTSGSGITLDSVKVNVLGVSK